MLDKFISAIRSKNKIRLAFFSKQDGREISRTCAPMDFGPSRKAANKVDRFHFWDYDSDTGSHTLSLQPQQISKMEIMLEQFEPATFVTWSTKSSPWFVERDWGPFT
jgi:hypothetical protein